ncbi:DUF5700 domain-containing putative Zn-dependent protease [Emcibacter sp.]|uniref:DUF5700 domain-containing putative Zn-dependent protease n=1 Tax=Emcibacter sp. TaxID=1979954 RepID=UPI003A902559
MISICLLAGTLSPAHADITVRLDTSLARNVMADICSGRDIDEDAIRHNPAIRDMLTHFRKFRNYITMDNYLDARRKAAGCQKIDRDYFRFNDVMNNRQEINDLLDKLSETQAETSARVARMIAPFSPGDTDFSGSAVVAVGTPSCGGWAVGDDFYIDLPCIRDDPEGMTFLIAHETYHAVQNEFMPPAPENDPVRLIMFEAIREGAASTLADFNKVDSDARYSRASKRSLRINHHRMPLNFTLLEMAISHLGGNQDGERYKEVYNIGFSGSFDAPFYAIGQTVIGAVDEAFGRPHLVCRLETSPEVLFLDYLDLTKKDSALPALGPATRSEVIKLEKDRTDCR